MYKCQRFFTVPAQGPSFPMPSSPGSSRHRSGRSTSSITASFQQNESLIMADSPHSQNSVELLANTVSTHEAEQDSAYESGQGLHWWRKPAAWWLMLLSPFSTIILSAKVAPEVELYTALACRVEKPEETNTSFFLPNHQPNVTPSFDVLFETLQTAPVQTAAFNPCSSDPAVQAAVAKLTTATSTGALTFLTVGWWGSFSDRYGRRRMMGISSIGHLISSFNIIFVAKYVEWIPGGYWFLVFDAVIAGALGGSSSEGSAILAYLADVSKPEKRSRLFSIIGGVLLVGFGIGPPLGSLLVRLTGSLLSVFYFAAAFRILHLCILWFMLPESLTVVQMQQAAATHAEQHQHSDAESRGRTWFRRLFFFLQPLSIFLPQDIPSKKGKKDWNLTILVLAFGVILLAMSSLIDEFLYAFITFQWDSEYLAYCISSIGFTRAAYLIVVLPVIIKFAKDRSVKAAANARSELSETSALLDAPSPPQTHSSSFDLAIARFSILVDVVTYGVLPFAPTGLLFVVFIALGSLGAGLVPAINSVALALYTQQTKLKNGTVESGKLFGALSVVQSLFAYILGPAMYGSIYAATVATAPRTIFFVAFGNAFVAFVLLTFVRLPPETVVSSDVEDLVDLRDASSSSSV
ncbi:major facilitator superfamily domain-containing protein [Mycena crocata]|nr:major facilitator superfamily domain-containing protein [Mycena crocata]